MPHARRRTALIVSLLALAAIVPCARAAEPAPGRWEGTLQVSGVSVPMTFNLRRDGSGGWSGDLSVPAQGLQGFPIGDVDVTGSSVTLTLSGLPGDPAFTGTASGDGGSIVGTFQQAGQSFPLTLRRTGDAAPVASSASNLSDDDVARVEGTWAGVLAPPGAKVRLVVHLKRGADGAIAGTLDSPDQGQTGLPISKVAVAGDELRLELIYAGAVFEGVIAPGGDEVAGSWSQGGGSLPLTLKKQGAHAASPTASPTKTRTATTPQTGSFPAATPASQGISAEAIRALAAHVQSLVDGEQVVGAEVAVIKNRRTVMHETFGWMDRESSTPMERGSIFCVRSMTKPLVGTAIQVLIDEGKLTLDTKAKDFLPSFDRPGLEDVTIDHLLTHSSGLPLTAMAQPLSAYRSLTDVADEAAEGGLAFAPGERFEYSDPGSDTLGAIVAEITGAPVEDFISERILEPLGMTTSIPVVAADDPRLARIPSAYSGGTGAWVKHWSNEQDPIFPIFLTSQSLYSTVQDYARFLALWMDGGRVGDRRLISDEAVRRGLTPRFAMRGHRTTFPGLASAYAQQWMVHPTEAEGLAGRPVVFGHGGSDGTHAWAWPDEDLMVLFFTQSRGTTVGIRLEGVLHSLLVEGQAATPVAHRHEVSDAELEQVAGLYWDDNTPYLHSAIVRRGDSISLERPDRAVIALIPSPTPGQFVHEATDQLQVEFERAAGGAVSAMLISTPRGAQRHARLLPDHGLPAVDRLLHRVRRAHGTHWLRPGVGVRLRGHLEMPARGAKGAITMTFDRRRLRADIVMGGAQERTVLDGTTAWLASTGIPPHELPEPQRTMALLGHPAIRHGDWLPHHDEVRVLRKAILDGREVFVVRTESAIAHGSVKYVDARTGRLVRDDRLAHVPGVGLVGTVARFSDFRKVGGMRFPFRTSVTYASELVGEVIVQFEEAVAGFDVPDDAFAPPPPLGPVEQ